MEEDLSRAQTLKMRVLIRSGKSGQSCSLLEREYNRRTSIDWMRRERKVEVVPMVPVDEVEVDDADGEDVLPGGRAVQLVQLVHWVKGLAGGLNAL